MCVVVNLGYALSQTSWSMMFWDVYIANMCKHAIRPFLVYINTHGRKEIGQDLLKTKPNNVLNKSLFQLLILSRHHLFLELQETGASGNPVVGRCGFVFG